MAAIIQRERRPVGLSVFVALLAIGSLAACVALVMGRMDMLADFSRVGLVVKVLYYPIAPLNLVSLYGVWIWRRWGVWMAVGLALLTLALEAYLKMPAVHLARVPMVLLLGCAFVAPHWRRFR